MRSELKTGVLSLALVLASLPLMAATHTWTGGGVDTNWSTNANWSPATNLAVDDDLVFPAGPANLVANNDYAAFTQFNSITVSGAGYTITGHGVVLDAAAGTGLTTAGASTISIPVRLGATQQWNIGTLPIHLMQLSGDTQLNGFNLTVNATLATAQFNGNFTGTGALYVSGSGLVVLHGPTNTFSGPLTVNSGRGDVNAGSISANAVANGGGTVGISSSGTVAGTTTINSGGYFEPGASGSGLGASGDLSLAAGASYRELVNGTAAGQYGNVTVTGTVNLGGANLLLQIPGLYPNGTQWTMIANDGSDPVVGTFSGHPEGAAFTYNGGAYKVSYTGGDGNDVVLTSLGPAVAASVPALDPKALLLLAAALSVVALAALRS